MAASRNRKAVVAVFADRADAERAVEELRRAGFKDSQIGLVSREKGRGGKKKTDETYVEEGAVAGAAVGAGVGGLVGLGILTGIIPAIGPVIAGGTLAVLLANAAGGAAIAGLAGALIGLGIPEEEAEYYESELKAGRTIVTVKATTRLEEARTILQRHNGYEQSAVPAATSATTRATAAQGKSLSTRGKAAGEEESIQLHEEQLEARKRPVKAGEVKVRKEVVTEHQTLEVPVEREEVVIERRPAGGRRASSTALQEGEEIRIPVRQEEVDVQKRTVARGEVSVGKRKVQDTKKVSGTVRKERARVESEGDVSVSGTESQTRVSSRKK